MKMFFSLSMLMISFMMLFLNHPLSMGLLILIQSIIICLMTGMMINTYWFSYILFLTFLGGLLVLFIYVSSIASNELFKNNFIYNNISSFMFIMILIMSFITPPLMKYNNFFFNEEMINFINNYLFYNNENKMNLSKLYNNHTFMLMMMMIIYLFITLVAVVKITNIFYGPLRLLF